MGVRLSTNPNSRSGLNEDSQADESEAARRSTRSENSGGRRSRNIARNVGSIRVVGPKPEVDETKTAR